MNIEEQRKQADAAYLAGRYCIGCQAVNVSTDWAGYCDSCLAAFTAREKERQEKQEKK